MTRWALGVEYDGSVFQGFQQQSHTRETVQGQLTRALSLVADHPLQLYCAGRTDSGVHATQQVIHFDSAAARTESAWVRGGNANLNAAIRVLWAQPTTADFHARFSARRRRYWYFFSGSALMPALGRQYIARIQGHYDIDAMHGAAQRLLGEHDFSSFRGAGCQSKTAQRHMIACAVRSRGPLIWIDLCANAFLLHMARNIVGALAAIGRGDQPVSWMTELLAAKDRRRAPATAPASGLYLVQVQYDRDYGFSQAPRAPWFIGSSEFGGW